jgi:hypothetical protein
MDTRRIGVGRETGDASLGEEFELLISTRG